MSKTATFGDRLRSLRTAKNWSVPELADAAGIHRVAVHMLERGTRLPGWETLIKLADALDASLDDFRGCEESEKKDKKPQKQVDK